MKPYLVSLVFALSASVFAPLPGYNSEVFAKCGDGPEPGVDWRDCRKRNVIMRTLDLRGANLSETELVSSDFSGSYLEEANFAKANIVRLRLNNVKAKSADFSKTVGSRISFDGADLVDASFSKAEISRVDFSNASLINTSFEKALFSRAVFSGSTLRDNDFSYSVLARSDFRNANIEGELNFFGAFTFLTRFEGIDLSASKGLAQWQVDMSCGSDNTKLPDGLTRPASWPCTIEEDD